MNKETTPEQNLENIDKFYEQLEKEKEGRLINLIAEIIGNASLKGSNSKQRFIPK